MEQEMIYRDQVRPEWVDYNGHMSEAFYVLIFGYATDAVYDTIGLDDAFRKENKVSAYTVEAHIKYLQEVSEGQTVKVLSRICGYDEKRIYLFHEMFAGSDMELTATSEILAVHVQTEPILRSAEFLPAIREAIAARYRPVSFKDLTSVDIGLGINIPRPLTSP